MRVRAHVLDDAKLEAGDGPVARGAQLHVLHLRAAVRHRDHVLRAGLDVAHRTAEPDGQCGHDELLRVRADLGAEATAHRRRDHADLVLLQPEPADQVALHPERRLTGHPGGQLTGRRVRDREDPVRLHGDGRDALVDDAGRDHDLGALQGALVAWVVMRHRDVRPRVGEQQRRALLQRGQRVHHHRERVVVDQHGLGRVHRLHPGLRHHDGDRLAHEAHGVGRQDGTREGLGGAALGVVRREVQVGSGVDAHDARHAGGIARVDAGDPRVGDRRADEHGVEPALGREVLRVLRLSGQEPRVLDPAHRVAEDRSTPHLSGREVRSGPCALVLLFGLPGQLALAHARESIREGP